MSQFDKEIILINEMTLDASAEAFEKFDKDRQKLLDFLYSEKEKEELPFLKDVPETDYIGGKHDIR